MVRPLGNTVLQSPLHRPNLSWFTSWFNSVYFDLYAHRTTAQAAIEVQALMKLLPDVPRDRVLDIACGNGRHLIALAEHYPQALGLELSTVATERARQNILQSGSTAICVRSDFRALPFRSFCFSLLTNFFTSFGYLDTEVSHLQLLAEWRRVLRLDGCLFIDFLNRDFVLSQLQAYSERHISGMHVEEHRSFNKISNRLEKRIVVHWPSKPAETYLESIRLFSALELQRLLTRSGFSIANLWGDFNGESFQSGSPRLLIQAIAN